MGRSGEASGGTGGAGDSSDVRPGHITWSHRLLHLAQWLNFRVNRKYLRALQGHWNCLACGKRYDVR